MKMYSITSKFSTWNVQIVVMSVWFTKAHDKYKK